MELEAQRATSKGGRRAIKKFTQDEVLKLLRRKARLCSLQILMTKSRDVGKQDPELRQLVRDRVLYSQAVQDLAAKLKQRKESRKSNQN